MERQLEKLKLDEPSKSQEAKEEEQSKIQEKCVSWRRLHVVTSGDNRDNRKLAHLPYLINFVLGELHRRVEQSFLKNRRPPPKARSS